MTPSSDVAMPVRVSIPASVAADIGSFKEITKSVLGKLGCDACCSGHNLYFEIQRDVVLRESLKDVAVTTQRAASRFASLTSAPAPVSVGLSPKVADSIEEVFVAIDRIADLTGHPACCSGRDLFMDLERMFVVTPRAGLEEQLMRFG